MTSFDDEYDGAAREEEEILPAPGSWNRPLLMAALGLALMLGGYFARNYVLAGRLAVFGGLFLFVMAGVLMYRSSPPPTKESDERE